MESETHKLARIHYEVGYQLTGEKKWYISNDKPIYEEYYSRLLPVIHGEFICPICDARDADGNPIIIDIGAKKHLIDPEVYFGVLFLTREDLVKTAALVSSETAIHNFYKNYHKLLKSKGDVLGFIRDNYKLSQDEYILNALKNGEKVISDIQQSRNLTRWEALVFCIDFNMVTDLYVISCKEAMHRWDELASYRPRLKEIRDRLADKQDYKSELLNKTITRVRKQFYNDGLREFPEYLKKGYTRRRKKSKYKSTLEAEWREGWK